MSALDHELSLLLNYKVLLLQELTENPFDEAEVITTELVASLKNENQLLKSENQRLKSQVATLPSYVQVATNLEAALAESVEERRRLEADRNKLIEKYRREKEKWKLRHRQSLEVAKGGVPPFQVERSAPSVSSSPGGSSARPVSGFVTIGRAASSSGILTGTEENLVQSARQVLGTLLRTLPTIVPAFLDPNNQKEAVQKGRGVLNQFSNILLQKTLPRIASLHSNKDWVALNRQCEQFFSKLEERLNAPVIQPIDLTELELLLRELLRVLDTAWKPAEVDGSLERTSSLPSGLPPPKRTRPTPLKKLPPVRARSSSVASISETKKEEPCILSILDQRKFVPPDWILSPVLPSGKCFLPRSYLPSSLKLSSSSTHPAMKPSSLCLAGSGFIWIGFQNGCLGVIDVINPFDAAKKDQYPIIYSQQRTSPKKSVEAMCLCPTQPHNQLWVGSASGELSVWKPQPIVGDQLLESLNLEGWLSHFDKTSWKRRWFSILQGRFRVPIGTKGEAFVYDVTSTLAQCKLEDNVLFLDKSCFMASADGPSMASVYETLQMHKQRDGAAVLQLLARAELPAPITTLAVVRETVWSTGSDQQLRQWKCTMPRYVGSSAPKVSLLGNPEDHPIRPLTPVRVIDVPTLLTALPSPSAPRLSSYCQLTPNTGWVGFGNYLITLRTAAAAAKLATTDVYQSPGQITALIEILKPAGKEIWVADNIGTISVLNVNLSSETPELAAQIRVSGSESAIVAMVQISMTAVVCCMASRELALISIPKRLRILDHPLFPQATYSSLVALLDPDSDLSFVWAGSREENLLTFSS